MPKFNNLQDFKHKKTVYLSALHSDFMKYKLLFTLEFAVEDAGNTSAARKRAKEGMRRVLTRHAVYTIQPRLTGLNSSLLFSFLLPR